MYPFAHVKVVGNKKIMKLTEAGLGNEKKTEDVEEFDTSEEKFLLDNVTEADEYEAEIHSENVREFREKVRSKRTSLESAIIWLHKMFERHHMERVFKMVSC